MIKVCHIVNLITGKADGVYKHILMLIRALDHNKYEHIIIFQGGEKIEKELNKLGIKIYPIKSLKKNFSLKVFQQIYRVVKKENVDIIHSHLIKPYVISCFVNIFLKKKHVFNYHGVFIDNYYYNYLEKIILKLIHFFSNKLNAVNLAVAPSFSSKELLLKETKNFKEIRTYYNTYYPNKDISLSNKISSKLLDLRKKYFLVGVIARIEIQKRIDRALEILKILRDEDVDVFFTFMGDGPLEKEMKLKVKELGLENYCEFSGFVENASDYLNNFDLLLLTSDWEGMPIVIWEAMAKGIPIVATDTGGIKEIIEANECGITYEKENIFKAAGIIKKLIKRPDLRKNIGEKGKIAIKEKYNLENFTNTFDNIYKKLIEN